MTICIEPDATALARVAAEQFTNLAGEAVNARGVFNVALSGGSTPKALFALLASEEEPFRARMPWTRTRFFWGDERHVPPDHPDSNYRMADEALLARIPVPADRVFRIPAENPDAAAAAAAYEQTLREAFHLQEGQRPRFDLVLLGLGPEGHTASLFPGSEAIAETVRWVVAPWVAKFNTYRITLTPPVLKHAAQVTFLASGGEKAEILRTVVEGEQRPEEFPAQSIRPTDGELTWLVDEAAARLLRRKE